MKPRLLALVGPTASGKSDLALELAREFKAEILSCDSLLVYRDLNVGTAKPSDAELSEIPHHGVNIVNLDQPFTAGDYVKYARPIIDRLVHEGKPVLIVGGTGFYLKALVCGTWDAPPTQPEVRTRIESEVAHLAPEEAARALHARLAAADPEYAAKIKVNDVYRVVRGLEIIEVTGGPVTAMLAKQTLQNPLPYPVPILGIKRTKQELERRIIERTNKMFAAGLVNETKGLLDRYAEPPRPFYCVGYNEVLQFLKSEMTMPETRERIVISTRQLAKKQMTFFKTFPAPIDWHTLPAERDELMRKAREALR